MDVMMFSLIFGSIFVKCIFGTEIQLNIPFGTLTGNQMETPKGNVYYSFQKIPFAEPPVGKLRFQAPVPIKPSTTVYNNTNGDVLCYQTLRGIPKDYMDMQSEDCLVLNIYTPKLLTNSVNASLPVYVFFFGGGFMGGAAHKDHLGPDFMIDENIIVAAVNYRTGPFGFLSTQDTIIPGNAGLKDQLLGLQWIHDNVKYFGGNASEITIGGESAGAASAVYFLLSKKTTGLFRGVIAESGSALNQWALQKQARKTAFDLVKEIDNSFQSPDSKSLLDTLQEVPADKLSAAAQAMSARVSEAAQLMSTPIFGPVLEVIHEDAYITEPSYELLVRGEIHKVPLLIGIASEESLMVAQFPDALKEKGKSIDRDSTGLIPKNMNILPGANRTAIGQEIMAIYTKSPGFSMGALVRYMSDNYFNRAIIKTAELMSKWNDVYFYQFSYEGSMTAAPRIEGAEHVSHVSERQYLWLIKFGVLENSDLSRFTKTDIKVHENLLQMFTNFVKFQNPSITDGSQPTVWPSIRAQGPEHFLYMNINDTLEVLDHPRHDTYPQWNDIFNKYLYMSDNMFNRAIMKTAELMSKWSDVYFYQLSYEGSMTTAPRIEGAEHVSHVSEHRYLWLVKFGGFDNSDLSRFTKTDIEVHENILKMFTNFVKFQNPSITDGNQITVWPSIKAQGPEHFLYMNINDTLEVLDHPRHDTYSQWNDIFNKYAVRPFETF